ncbi:hypothetical protein PR202_gb23892 [Eleusine coracana subsp. coracana]|uniref:Retrotransposon gag domain-containing protein n=1 Tax=Eleusine coracana subsp. coracana TaxID=191504 RepID=A0AAV5FJT1_ELECO|nr:hypothetical protein PR202_gb23892 [Eleusine coracana subsp. coracana]
MKLSCSVNSWRIRPTLEDVRGNRNNNQPRQCTYSDFLGTHPPMFERAREPLDADHWLRQTESKFGLLDCTEHQKVLFAAQQLQGSASAWWANYEATLPAGRRLEWNEFKTAFRAHFIPAALMQRKLQEFTDLKQGGRNVLQYSEAFNHLAQYASEYVNTEEKKRYAFLRGMNAKLKERLTWQQTGTYNDLVNAAIVQEGAMRQVEEEDRKRKAPASASEDPPRRSIAWYSPHQPDSDTGHPCGSNSSVRMHRTTQDHHSSRTFFPVCHTSSKAISIVHRISSKGTQMLVLHSLLTVEATIHVTTVVALATLLRTVPHLDATTTTTSTSVRTRTEM